MLNESILNGALLGIIDEAARSKVIQVANVEENAFARSLAPATLLWLDIYRKHQPDLFALRG